MKRVAIAIACTALTLLNGVAYADAPQPPSTDGYYLRDYSELTQSAPSQPWWTLTFDLVIKLGLVIGLIYLTMWALRRYVLGPQAKRNGSGQLTGRLELLDTTHLAPNRTVYLVEVADRILVLGATPNTLTTLAEIREPGAIDLLKARPLEAAAAALPSFSEQFTRLAGSIPVASVASSAPSFLHDKIGELRALTATLRRAPADESPLPTGEG